jgi:hypothetical protein
MYWREVVDDADVVALRAPELGLQLVSFLGCVQSGDHCWAVASINR